MSNQWVKLEVENGVAWITLVDPNGKNAVHLEFAKQLMDVAFTCRDDAQIRVVILTSAESVFSVGGDLKSFAKEKAHIATHIREVTTYFHTAISQFTRMKKPVVAAVNGMAAGAGMSLALACDLVYANESAKFTMAYTRVGLTPDGSATYFLPRIVGVKKALELAMTNNILSSKDAQNLGLVAQVFPDESFLSEVAQLARTIADGPIEAFGLTKALIYQGQTETLETQLAAESAMIAGRALSAEGIEGIEAFIAKRKPKFNKENDSPKS